MSATGVCTRCSRGLYSAEYTKIGSLLILAFYLLDLGTDVYVLLPLAEGGSLCKGFTGACRIIREYECSPRDFQGNFESDSHWYEESCPVKVVPGLVPGNLSENCVPSCKRAWEKSDPIRVLGTADFNLDSSACMEFVNVTGIDSRGINYAGFPVATCKVIKETYAQNEDLCSAEKSYDFTADDFLLNGDVCLSNAWVLWRFLVIFGLIGFTVMLAITLYCVFTGKPGMTSLQIYVERFLVSIKKWKTKEAYIELTHPDKTSPKCNQALVLRILVFIGEFGLEVGSIFLAIFLLKVASLERKHFVNYSFLIKTFSIPDNYGLIGIQELADTREELGLNFKIVEGGELSASYVSTNRNGLILSLCLSILYEGVGFMSYGFRYFLFHFENSILAVTLMFLPTVALIIGVFQFVGGVKTDNGNLVILFTIPVLGIYALLLHKSKHSSNSDSKIGFKNEN